MTIDALFERAKHAARRTRNGWHRWRQRRMLAALRRRVWNSPAGRVETVAGFTIKVADGPNYYMQYKDEFVRGIYRFAARTPSPVIVDGGSNVGMSILAFKKAYPAARVTGFEPDPALFETLRENVERNGLRGVTLVNAGLADREGTSRFDADGSAGGRISSSGGTQIRLERLSNYLEEPIDFLKLNIEGEELAVLREVAESGRLKNVREMVVEYHGWPSGPQRLGAILELLDANGFRYLVHDFDDETCATSKPPFGLSGAPWFCLVYAKRAD